MDKIRWGILSTAKIGLNKVIPAMQKGKYSLIHAIASRDIEKAEIIRTEPDRARIRDPDIRDTFKDG